MPGFCLHIDKHDSWVREGEHLWVEFVWMHWVMVQADVWLVRPRYLRSFILALGVYSGLLFVSQILYPKQNCLLPGSMLIKTVDTRRTILVTQQRIACFLFLYLALSWLLFVTFCSTEITSADEYKEQFPRTSMPVKQELMNHMKSVSQTWCSVAADGIS